MKKLFKILLVIGTMPIGFVIGLTVVLVFANISSCIPSPKAYAGQDIAWEVFSTGKVIDLDPMYQNQFGIMVHFDTGSWATMWKSQLQGVWPAIGETGTLYHTKDNLKWKWAVHALKTEPKPKPKQVAKQVAKPAPKVVIVQIESDWKKASLFPKRNKVVVVKFNNGLTSTAYVNKYDEWKLDMNRNDYKGGKTLIDIKNWKAVNL